MLMRLPVLIVLLFLFQNTATLHGQIGGPGTVPIDCFVEVEVSCEDIYGEYPTSGNCYSELCWSPVWCFPTPLQYMGFSTSLMSSLEWKNNTFPHLQIAGAGVAGQKFTNFAQTKICFVIVYCARLCNIHERDGRYCKPEFSEFRGNIYGDPGPDCIGPENPGGGPGTGF